MINSSFYAKTNVTDLFFGGKVKHFPIRKPTFAVTWYKYTIKAGESIYTIAERIFGNNSSYMWTYIADNNRVQHPDSWKEGDVIKLPKILVKASEK